MRLHVGCWVIALVLGGCTEPNPFAQMDSDDASTTAMTASTTTPSTSTSGTSMDATSTTASTSTTDETTDVTTMMMTTTDDTTGSTGEPVCPSGHACVEEAPQGWTGPVIVARTTTGQPTCEGDFPTASLTAFGDLVAPPATCECECDAPTGLNCGFPTLEYFSQSTTCAGSPQGTWVINSACELVSGAAGEHWRIEPPPVTDGECSPELVTNEVTPAEWDTTLTACAGTFDAVGCEEGALCVRMPSAPFDAAVCIWSEGDVPCPGGAYFDRSVYYTDFSDTRDCGACGCDDAEGECEGRVRTFQDQTCTSPVNTFTADDVCRQGNNIGVGSAEWEWNAADVTASCAPTGGDPVGLAAPTEPHTICCVDV